MEPPAREATESPPPVVEETVMETRVVSLVTTPSVDTTSVTSTVSLNPIVTAATTTPSRAIMDPRLAPRISTSELVGKVEKTLSFLGYEDKKQSEAITPTKRKVIEGYLKICKRKCVYFWYILIAVVNHRVSTTKAAQQ